MSSDSMDNGAAVSVRNVGKCYHIYDKPQDRLKQALWRGRKRFYNDFWALRDVSFDVPRGQSVGIIGPNGAGKSTLLQIIVGTLMPSEGEARVNGRVAALLELGSGFNPDFTGRENVFMNASILGLSQEEIRARLGQIEAFADIGEFFNEPVKVYSTGMAVRLAFSVAVHVDADILIVDEALSVGDLHFQAKCISKIRELLDDATKTLVFVSHGVDVIKSLCRNTLLLWKGRQIGFGPSEMICDEYLAMMAGLDRPGPARTTAKGPDGAVSPSSEVCAEKLSAVDGYARRQVRVDLNHAQEQWQTVRSGKLPPGRYRAIIRSGRSSGGAMVSVRRFEVSLHSERREVAPMHMASTSGWQTLRAQTDLECLRSEREDETLEFEFTGHELAFEGLRHSSAGVVELLVEPLARGPERVRPASELYRPSDAFGRRVAPLRRGSQQARFTNLEVLGERGEPVELIPSGDEILLRAHLETSVDVACCNVGCVIRDETGRDLLTVNTFDEHVNWPHWRAGEPRVMEVRFKAAFRPGTYVVATGISQSVPIREPGDQEVFDFCPNAGTFKVMDERSGRPCWGLVRLPASIEILA